MDDGCKRPDRSVQHRRAGPGEVGKANHFAAWQEPNLFTTVVRARIPVTALIGVPTSNGGRHE
jgi:hypothetical protein